MKRNETNKAGADLSATASSQCTGDGSGNGRCKLVADKACKDGAVPPGSGDKNGTGAGNEKASSWLLIGPDFQL